MHVLVFINYWIEKCTVKHWNSSNSIYTWDLTVKMYNYPARRRHCGLPVWSTEPVWVQMKTNSSISGHVTPQNSLATPRPFPFVGVILLQPNKWLFFIGKVILKNQLHATIIIYWSTRSTQHVSGNLLPIFRSVRLRFLQHMV